MKNYIFIKLTPEELKEIIHSEFNKCLMEVEKKLKEENNDDELLTMNEVSKMFKVSRQSLLDWRKSGQLSYRRMGRRIYFKRSDIDNSLKKIDLSKYKKGILTL